jgi:hypothetical protein
MPIEDVDYLKQNSIVKNFQFLVDSGDRDKIAYPDPSLYTITLTQPLYNVIGFKLLDASIPRTEYVIDTHNNGISFYIFDNNTTDITTVPTSNYTGADGSRTMNIGDYNIVSFINQLNSTQTENAILNVDGTKLLQRGGLGPGQSGESNGPSILVSSLSPAPELRSQLLFTCTSNFVLDMKASTMSEALGFQLNALPSEELSPNPSYSTFIAKSDNLNRQLFKGVYNSSTYAYQITPPGLYDLYGSRELIIRCPEIESHDLGSLAFTKNCLGLAKIRLGVLGYSDNTGDYASVKPRNFHPIAKLSKITFRFEKRDGSLYNFKGMNHTMTFSVQYYEPIQKQQFKQSILNPNYNGNFIEYMRNFENEEYESDDQEEEYSRDFPENYKGIENRHMPDTITNMDNEALYRFNLNLQEDD